MGKLHDEDRFKHVTYHHTDVRKTFKRIRDRMEAEKKEREEALANVSPIGRKKARA